MTYTPIVILICNIIIYLLISLIFLTVGFITGIHKKIGIIVITSILILVGYIMIGDIIIAINNGGITASIVNGGIVNGDDPLIMYIGSFVAGITGDWWYKAGKRAGKMIKYRFFPV